MTKRARRNELLREERLSRGWSLSAMAEQVHDLAFRLGEPETAVDGQMVSRWERGLHRPSPRYVRLLCLLFDEGPERLGLPGEEETKPAGRSTETFDLARCATAPDVDPASVDNVHHAVERLNRAYSTVEPGPLLASVQQRLWQVDQLLRGRVTLDQHRDLLEAAGWLHTLLAALHYDLGDREAADVSRNAALHLGREIGNAEIQGWAFETPAWITLFDGRARDAVDLCVAGQQVAPPTSWAFVALNMQEARAWARLGDRRAAEQALLRGTAVLDRLPEAEHPDDHFVFDREKFAYYASTTYAWLGMAKHTERYATEVIRNSGSPRRRNFWPGRVRGVHFDLGLALAKRGRPDEASNEGLQGLTDYTPRTWVLRRAADLDRALAPHRDVREVQDFHERYIDARRDQGDTTVRAAVWRGAWKRPRRRRS
jgi:transcriptional regulator with XRE-family HTH domain